MSQEDAMIMALAGMLEQNIKYKHREPKSKSNGQDKSNVKTNDNESGSTNKKTGWKISEWKKIAPKDGEPKEKEVNGKNYWWCAKCRQGEGMWARHKEQDHKENFQKEANKNPTIKPSQLRRKCLLLQ